MKRFFLSLGVLLALFLFSHQASAQDLPPPYLLPQTIFVGDSGRLVVPLGPTFAGFDSFVLETFDMLSEISAETPDLVFRRIELERRGDRSRLIIDFIPFDVGVLTLPCLAALFAVENFPEAEFFRLSGLEVQVASVLNPY